MFNHTALEIKSLKGEPGWWMVVHSSQQWGCSGGWKHRPGPCSHGADCHLSFITEGKGSSVCLWTFQIWGESWVSKHKVALQRDEYRKRNKQDTALAIRLGGRGKSNRNERVRNVSRSRTQAKFSDGSRRRDEGLRVPFTEAHKDALCVQCSPCSGCLLLSSLLF